MGAGVIGKFVAQKTEEGDGPGIAGNSRREIAFRETREAVLEYSPKRAGIGKYGGNLIGQIAFGFEAEIGRFLAGHIRGNRLVKQLRAEQTAFDSDGGKGGHLRFTIYD